MLSLADHSRSWAPDPQALEALFDADERTRIAAARRAVDPAQRTVAYCVWENPFARSGGIFAVATHLPPALRAAGEETVLLTPFHRNLRTTPDYPDLHFIGEVQVPFVTTQDVKVELFEHYDKLGNRWIMLQSWGLFDAPGGAAGSDPYAHGNSYLLLRDSLFFSQAVPQVLAFLGLHENVLVHAQDWQTAPTALTVKQAILDDTLESAATVLTSHNPYDHPLPEYNISWITDRAHASHWPLGQDTVYQRMIPLTDAPLSTVSPGFARELTEDALQTGCFAAHLQQTYRAHGVVGIDNPLFGEPKPAFSKESMLEASAGVTDRIVREKRALRRRMLEILSEYDDARIWGRLEADGGAPVTELPDDVPVFMMFGRLDPGQKGFDVLARAIEGFARGAAKFVLTPIVVGGGPFVDDLRGLAERRRGDVAVYPFRMEHGYTEAMAGATYAVMPSLYEPFGAATEAYLAGTPVVARATGGLNGQVNDFAADPAEATGFLFREKLPLGSSWPAILNAPGPWDRVGIPLYAMIAEALFDALTSSAKLWRNDRSAYGRMLANLYSKAAGYSGQKAAAGYRALYDRASASQRPNMLE